MKKLMFLFLGLFVLFSVSVSAQAPTGPKILSNTVGYFLSTPTHAVTDTITDATAKSQYAIIQGSNAFVTVQSLYTRVSGTAAGTIALQGSIDGVNWSTTLATAFTLTNVASQVATFNVVPSQYQYYRVVVTPSGTQSCRIVTKALVRK